MTNPPGQGNPGFAPLTQGQEPAQPGLAPQPQPGPPQQHMPQPPPGIQQAQYQSGYPQPPAVNGMCLFRKNYSPLIYVVYEILGQRLTQHCIKAMDPQDKLRLQEWANLATR